MLQSKWDGCRSKTEHLRLGRKRAIIIDHCNRLHHCQVAYAPLIITVFRYSPTYSISQRSALTTKRYRLSSLILESIQAFHGVEHHSGLLHSAENSTFVLMNQFRSILVSQSLLLERRSVIFARCEGVFLLPIVDVAAETARRMKA